MISSATSAPSAGRGVRGLDRGGRYSHGTYTVRLHHTYAVLVSSDSRPRYVDASPYPRKPAGNDRNFRKVGHHLWALGVTIATALHAHRYWTIGVRIGRTVHVLKIRVVR